MIEERIIDLETKLTYQEALLEQLSKVLYEQQNKIAQLEATLAEIVKRSQEATDPGLEIGPANEKPPHY